MAQLFDFMAHHRVKTSDGRAGYKVTPWVQVRQGENPPVVICNGCYYSGGGKLLDECDIPAWVTDQVRTMNPDTRESIGLPRRMAAKPDASLAKR